MEVEFHGKQSPPKWVITYLRNESVGGGGGGGGGRGDVRFSKWRSDNFLGK